MSETPEKTNVEAQLRKYCMDGNMEGGGTGKIKVRKTSTDDGIGSEGKRKWPVLCDTDPYIVDIMKKLFRKEETLQQEPEPEPEPETVSEPEAVPEESS